MLVLDSPKPKKQFISVESDGNGDGDVDGDGDGMDEESEVTCQKKLVDESGFLITLYGWAWYSDVEGQYISSGQTEGQWHFNPKDCFSEAMSCKPAPVNYKLDVFNKKELVNINKSLLDAALAKLININVEMCADEDRSLSLYNSEWQDMDIYGKTVLERICISDIYDLCKKAVSYYATMTQEMELFLMKETADYQKADSILSDITAGVLDKILMELFDYIYSM